MVVAISIESILIGFLIGILVYYILKNKKLKEQRERIPYVLKDANSESITMDADQIVFELFRKNIILMKHNSDEHQKAYDNKSYYQYKHPTGIIYTYPTFDSEHPITIWENNNLINCDTRTKWEPWTKSVYDLAKEAYEKRNVDVEEKLDEK